LAFTPFVLPTSNGQEWTSHGIRKRMTEAKLLALRERIRTILVELIPNAKTNERGALAIPYGSTMVAIDVHALGETKTAVMVCALMNLNVPTSPGLYEWIATKNDSFMFGHIGMRVLQDGKASLTFVDSLHGEDLNPEHLKQTLGAVATTADKLDDEVKAQFGGDRWVDQRAD
jgi:Putative bacterial sensory transduction regulator